MRPQFEYGQEVRLIRNVRNDGTYPGKEVGELLMRRGSVGVVYDVGTYLQDQLIYRVHFLDQGRTIGCREEELIPAAEHWVQSRFEFREEVVATRALAVRGEVRVALGQGGQVMKVVRDLPGGTQYQVHFGNGLLLQVPEEVLDAPQAVEQATEPKPAQEAGHA